MYAHIHSIGISLPLPLGLFPVSQAQSGSSAFERGNRASCHVMHSQTRQKATICFLVVFPCHGCMQVMQHAQAHAFIYVPPSAGFFYATRTHHVIPYTSCIAFRHGELRVVSRTAALQ